MSMTFHYMPIAVAGIAGLHAHEITGSVLLAVVTGVMIAALTGLIWWFSPLPHHNGGWGMPPAKLQQWGLTTEPREGYADPTTAEVMSTGMPWGFMFARREDGNE